MVTVASHAWDCDAFLEASSGFRILGGDGGVIRTTGLFAILASFTHGGIFIGEVTEAQAGGSKVSSHA